MTPTTTSDCKQGAPASFAEAHGYVGILDELKALIEKQQTQYTPAHDDEHRNGEILEAAIACAWPTALKDGETELAAELERFQYFGRDSFGFRVFDHMTTREHLLIAASLIIAEIARKDRAKAQPHNCKVRHER